MERLNDIMGRSPQRRQLSSDQRRNPGAGDEFQEEEMLTSHHPISHHPTPDVRAEQKKLYGSRRQHQYMSSTKPRNTRGGRYITPATDKQEDHFYQGSAPPLYPRQPGPPLERSARYQQHTASYQEDGKPPANMQSSGTPRGHYYRDEYLPSLPQADVIDEWDEEEDTGGMLYGDWEKGVDEIVVYRQASKNVVAEVDDYYAPVEQEIPHPEPLDERAYRPHDSRDSRMPVPMPRARRVTQPLNPQAIVGLKQERAMLQEAYQQQRGIRQIVPQEEMKPIPTSSMAPPLPKSACPKCKGAGYLRADVPFGHPSFGKPIPCECKEHDWKEKRRQQLRAMSNLDAFRSNSFATFNPRVMGVQEAYQEAVAYAENPDGWLLLQGPNGCGKTHLAVAIAKHCLDNGSVALFAVVPDLLDHLRAAFAPSATEMYDQLFAKMREAELLVLDDLGSQQSSPWANEKLFQLLNYRYNMGMPTVITANPTGLQGIDVRIRSRLSDNSLVTIVTFDRAQDYRPRHPRRD